MVELRVSGIVVNRSGRRVLDGVGLEVASGELVAIMGGTGAGKSTLALVLAGLLTPSTGHVEGAASNATRLVLQRPEASFLTDRVVDEVALAPRAQGESEVAARQQAHGWLAALGLAKDVSERDPLTLSGGEQRRVAVAAALAVHARVLVLDEPSAGLDYAARQQLHSVIHELHAAGCTIVLVTHDPDEAAQLATRLVVLREGRVVHEGGVEDVLGDPKQARAVGLRVAPEVELLHEVAGRRGVAVDLCDTRPATAKGAIDVLAQIMAIPARGVAQSRAHTPAPSAAAELRQRSPLPRLIDARVRLVAAAAGVVAALTASTLLAAAIVLACVSVLVAFAAIERVRLRMTVQPLIMLAVLLVALQLIFGGDASVELRRGVEAASPAAPAILRAMQAASVVLVTLVLSARTTTLDLATALRRLLAPLRMLRVPVAALAFVVATGIGLVPTMADELERLRLAQRARGLRRARTTFIARLRADAMLTAPLFVAAFRRAHLLADALAVRSIDPRRTIPAWRTMVLPPIDALLLSAGIALLVMARFV